MALNSQLSILNCWLKLTTEIVSVSALCTVLAVESSLLSLQIIGCFLAMMMRTQSSDSLGSGGGGGGFGSGGGAGQGAGQGGSQRKGLLLDKSPAELKVCGIDVSDPKYSSEDLFGTLSGSAFLDAVYGAFGVDERDIPWFFTGEGGKKERAIRRSPLSRPI